MSDTAADTGQETTDDTGAEDTAPTAPVDRDADGYSEAEDCDDTDAQVFPGADELCNEIDDDCDEVVDEESIDAQAWYPDVDEDGAGDPDGVMMLCEAPEGAVEEGSDCDDSDAALNTMDLDGDGFSTCEEDCDDDDDERSPGIAEVCDDGVDNDCDGTGDEYVCVGDYDLSEVADVLFGEASEDYAGNDVSGVGDVNGDGSDDFLVGAYLVNDARGQYSGAAYLVLGAVTGNTSLADADASFLAEGTYDAAGSDVSGAGDVNGDGYADLLIGADDRSAGPSLPECGGVYVVLGGPKLTGEMSLRDADASLIGESGSNAAAAISAAGDVDGDGIDDFVVGAWGIDRDAGAAYLISGGALTMTGEDQSLAGAAAKWSGEAQDDKAGYAVSGVGDVDGDGLGDLLIGARDESSNGNVSGAAYVILDGGSGELSLADADAKLVGSSSDVAGFSVGAAGDVDGDGLQDMLVGAINVARMGAAYLVAGDASGALAGEISLAVSEATFLGENTSDNAGVAVSGAGDINGDGFEDVLIGATGERTGGGEAGAAYLVLGPVSGSLGLDAADARFIGEASGDYAGISVSGVGDVDSDGFDDFMIGAYRLDEAARNAGGAYLLYGGAF